MSYNGFKGEEFRRVSADAYAFEPAFSTGLLHSISNQTAYLDKVRGSRCSVGFGGRTGQTDSLVHCRPLVSAGRWGAFLIVPYWVQPGLAFIDLEFRYRTGFGGLQNESSEVFDAYDSRVQLRAYLASRNGGAFPGGAVASYTDDDNETFWSVERISIPVDSQGLDSPVRDVLIFELNSDPTVGRTESVFPTETSRQPDAFNGGVIDGSGLVVDLFPTDAAPSSPESESMWLTAYKLADLGGNRVTFHDGMANDGAQDGVVFPFPQVSNQMIFTPVWLPYLQISNVDISERYRKEVSRVDRHQLAPLRDATAHGIGSIAAAANAVSERWEMVCGRLESNRTPNAIGGTKMDNQYGLRDFWHNPFVKGENTVSVAAAGKTRFEKPRFIGIIEIIGSHDLFEDVAPVDFNQDGGNSAYDELKKFTIDGLMAMTIDIVQDGSVVGSGTVNRSAVKFWPSFLSDASHTLLQTHVAERGVTDGFASSYRNGIYDIDQGNGTDAFLFSELAVDFDADPEFDVQCEFSIRVTFGLEPVQDRFPRWAADSIYTDGDYVVTSGPTDVVAIVPATPVLIAAGFSDGLAWVEYDSRNDDTITIELDSAHGAQPGDRAQIKGAPVSDANGFWSVVAVVGFNGLVLSPETTPLSWNAAGPGGTVTIQRSSIDRDAMRMDVSGFSLWAAPQ